jgi:hypothetical protein
MFARYGAFDGSPQYMHPPSCSVPGAYAPTAASQGGGGPEWWLIAIALQDEVALGCRRRRSNKSSNGGLDVQDRGHPRDQEEAPVWSATLFDDRPRDSCMNRLSAASF